MNKRFISKLLAVVLIMSSLQVSVWAEPPAGKKRGTQENREEGKGRRPEMKPPLGDMSPEDKAAMKKALQAVWENPEVMQARDEVMRATEAFRKAIRKAVSKEDPRVAGLVERMHGGGKSKEWDKKRPGSDGRGGRLLMGRPPGVNDRGSIPGAEGRGIGAVGLMAFHGDFSEEEKKRLEEAREKAIKSEAFQQVQKDLRNLLKQGEDLRKKRVEMFHQTREAMIQAMIVADPKVKPLLQRMKTKTQKKDH